MEGLNSLGSDCEDQELSESDVSSEEEYEKRRSNSKKQQKVEHLLPAKSKSGLIFRSVIIKDDEVATAQSETGATESDAVTNEKETVVSKNFVQLYANQRKRLEELKTRVGILASHVVEDPENNMRSLKELISMLQNDNTNMIISEKKLVALSLLHVFTDVLPGYRIRIADETDKKIKLKKETRKLMDYETTLLRNYKKYLDCLHVMVNNLKGKKKQGQVSVAQRKAQQEIGLVAVKCLCNLLISKMNFNYYKNIANILVPLATSNNNAVSSNCCQAIEKLYRSDKLGEPSLDVVKLTCKILKERKFVVPENLMLTFLHLNVQEANLKDGKHAKKQDMKKLRKQLNMMSRKERKNSKKMRELEKQLREVEAQESVEMKSKFHTEILQKIFWVYFHVIKDSQKFSLLSPVLQGLSKFAHLINLEYFHDLSVVLCSIMQNEMLSDADKFRCMQTMFTILLGHAEALNVDPQKMYCHLYKILLNLQLNSPIENYVLAANCIELMIIKRKKKISINRILAFIKRLCTVALQAPIPGILICLSMVRKIMMSSSNSNILLDNEETVGSGMFYPELEDPEHCNAHSCVLWELNVLCHHSNPTISVFANHILHGCPIQGPHCIPTDLSNMSPEEFINRFSDNDLCNGKNIKMSKSNFVSSRKRKLSSSFCTDDGAITWTDVKRIKF